VSVVVESAELRELVADHLIAAENANTEDETGPSPLQRTCTNLARVSTNVRTEDSARRNLHNLREGMTMTTAHTRADEILIAVGRWEDLGRLTVLFTTPGEALEAADCYFDARGIDADEATVRTLARDLHRFCRGYIAAIEADIEQHPSQIRDRELKRERQRKRPEAVAA
jgi:hypothetical protein